MKKLPLLPILLFCLAALFSCKSKYSVLIKNADIYDGKIVEARKGDVALKGDRIVFIGDSKAARIKARNTIDAAGYILAPGFIDVHTHSLGDILSPKRHANLNYLMQGVTTVITGNDGGGPINIGETLAVLDKQGVGTNAALLCGQGTLRKYVMDMSDAEPSHEEMDQMKKILRQAMDEGAFGMSAGLYYTPGNFARTEEVIELAKIVAQKGGIYDTHIRDESSYSIGLDSAVKEVIQIARQSGIRANISHIKALGVDVWGKSQEIIESIEQAQVEGLQITADQYPYRASGTSITNALVPRWAFAGDVEANMKNPELLPRIRKEMEDNLRRRGGPDALLFTDVNIKHLYGKTLKDIAEMREEPVMKTAFDIIMDGGSRVASFNMNPEDLKRFMLAPWVMTSSDGSSGHPRKYGSYPKKIREYVQEKNYLDLGEMIRKSTSLPAKTFNIKDRGEIKEGYFADLLLFKVGEIQDAATYQNPAVLAEGMYYVIVNGKLVVEKGEFKEVLAGKALRRPTE